MSEIWNLSEVCRCCHSSGVFKSLLDPFTYEGNVEVYSELLRDIFGIHMRQPPFAASRTICDQCIIQLRFCRNFKQQVLECERKFQEYCKNELFNATSVKVEQDDDDEASADLDDEFVKNDDSKKKTLENAYNEREDASKVKTESKSRKKTERKETNDSIGKTHPKQNKPVAQAAPFTCEFCKQRFDKKPKLQEHEFQRHNVEALSCRTCELTFRDHGARALHMKKHNSTDNGLRCEHCDKYYGTERALIAHINSHAMEDSYQCEVCPKRFPYKHTLRRHRAWHRQKFNETNCNICPMTFKNTYDLRVHKLRNHNPQLRKEREKRKAEWRKRRGPYICVVCHKAFSTDYTLKRHNTTVHGGPNAQTGAKPHICDVCGSRFSQRGALTRHTRNKHDNVNKITKQTCTICNKAYKDWMQHKKLHDRPFKCDRCFKSYPERNALNRHIKYVHLGMDPFPCEHCDQKYRRLSHLKRHLLKRHNIKAVKTESGGENVDSIETIFHGINDVMSRLDSTC